MLAQILGVPPVLMGFASPDDGLHGPNERFSLRNFDRAVRTCIAFLEACAMLRLRRAA